MIRECRPSQVLEEEGIHRKQSCDFCERIGVSKANSVVDVSLLEHCVREDLKTKVESRNVVEKPIKVIITNYPEDMSEMMEIENNKEVPEMGSRMVPFSRELWVDGEDFQEFPEKKYFRLFPSNEVRFKGAYFITCNEVVKNEDGSVKAVLALAPMTQRRVPALVLKDAR